MPNSSLIPLYVAPTATGDTCTSNAWHSVASGGPSIAAIINPNSGPISAADQPSLFSAYIACMTLLHAAGVEVLAYVPTKTTTFSGGVWTQTGFRSAASVTAMLELYTEGEMGSLLSGIFVDETSNRWQATSHADWGDHTAYYRSLFRQIRQLGVATIGRNYTARAEALTCAASASRLLTAVLSHGAGRGQPRLLPARRAARRRYGRCRRRRRV
jgi:hypothetical protein